MSENDSDYPDEYTTLPGLHRVGPAPYDFVYNAAKGQKLSFVGLDGERFTGTVSNVEENEETGTKTITMQRWPDDDSQYFTID